MNSRKSIIQRFCAPSQLESLTAAFVIAKTSPRGLKTPRQPSSVCSQAATSEKRWCEWRADEIPTDGENATATSRINSLDRASTTVDWAFLSGGNLLVSKPSRFTSGGLAEM